MEAFPRYWEFTCHRGIPCTKASDAELWCFLWSAPWIKGWVNSREAGDLRRHRAHYDVIVMTAASLIYLVFWCISAWRRVSGCKWESAVISTRPRSLQLVHTLLQNDNFAAPSHFVSLNWRSQLLPWGLSKLVWKEENLNHIKTISVYITNRDVHIYVSQSKQHLVPIHDYWLPYP